MNHEKRTTSNAKLAPMRVILTGFKYDPFWRKTRTVKVPMITIQKMKEAKTIT
jgi:hypothetical protein